MTSGSSIISVFVSVFITTATFAFSSGSGQPPTQRSNLLLFKRQAEQLPVRQSYLLGTPSEVSRFDGVSSQVPHQPAPLLGDDLHHKTRGTLHIDELPLLTAAQHLRPVETPTPANVNPRTMYYPLQFGAPPHHHKDFPCTDTHSGGITNKLIGLANALGRAPALEASPRSADLLTSASQIHQEVCAPPNDILPPPQLAHPCSPQAPLCDSNKPPHPVMHAPKVNALKNIFPPDPTCPYENRPEEPLFTQTSCIPVSPLHPASKHTYPEPSCPCTPTEAKPASQTCDPPTKPPCSCVAKLDVVPVPAEKQVLVHNPFSTEKCDVPTVPKPKQNPKYVLHHRQHSKECPQCYPEAYAPQSKKTEAHQTPFNPQVPYLINYQGLGYQGLGYQNLGYPVTPGLKPMYPFVPPPNPKPIPLIVPPCADEVDVDGTPCQHVADVDHHHAQCACAKCCTNLPCQRYRQDGYFDEKSWSRDILRDIAEKLGCFYDEEDDPRLARRRQHDEQEDCVNQRRGYDRYFSTKPTTTKREYYEVDDDGWRN